MKQLRTTLLLSTALIALAGVSHAENVQQGSVTDSNNSVGTTSTQPSDSMYTNREAASPTPDDAEKMNNAQMQTNVDAVSRAEVKDAQAKLRDEGFKVSADGVIGARTISAIRQYQSQNNLQVTGKLDAATLEKLGVEAKASAGAS